MFRTIVIAGAAIAVATPVFAQRESNVGEMVVTASRRAVVGGYNQTPATPLAAQPHVVIFHRADNLIVDVVVECDTRDQSDRLSELRSTLKNVVAAAEADGVELGVADADAGVIVPFRLEGLNALLSPGARVDTTRVTFIAKTRIRDGDTFEAASARIDGFLKKIKTVGRSQATRSGDWQLTLVSPRQYRPQIVAAIAKDANDTAAAVGPDYRVQLVGMERQIGWSRSGPLELALYIPYTMNVTPAAAGR